MFWSLQLPQERLLHIFPEFDFAALTRQFDIRTGLRTARAILHGTRITNDTPLSPLYRAKFPARARFRIRSPAWRCRDYTDVQKTPLCVDDYGRNAKVGHKWSSSSYGTSRWTSERDSRQTSRQTSGRSSGQSSRRNSSQSPRNTNNIQKDPSHVPEAQPLETLTKHDDGFNVARDAALKIYHKSAQLDISDIEWITSVQTCCNRYNAVLKQLETHQSSFDALKKLHAEGTDPGFEGWLAEWTLNEFDIGWLKECMRLSCLLTRIEEYSKAFQEDGRDLGLIAHAEQESDFPSTAGGYTSGTVKRYTEQAPVWCINRWLATLSNTVSEPAAVPKTGSLMANDHNEPDDVKRKPEDGEFILAHEVESWESINCRPADRRVKPKIVKSHTWAEETRTRMRDERERGEDPCTDDQDNTLWL